MKLATKQAEQARAVAKQKVVELISQHTSSATAPEATRRKTYQITP